MPLVVGLLDMLLSGCEAFKVEFNGCTGLVMFKGGLLGPADALIALIAA